MVSSAIGDTFSILRKTFVSFARSVEKEYTIFENAYSCVYYYYHIRC